MRTKISTVIATAAIVVASFVGSSMLSPGAAKAAPQQATVAPAAAMHSDDVNSTYWWGSQTWYSRSDVRSQASWWGVVRIADAICNETPGLMRSACNATVGAYTGWIYNTWIYAKNTNQCLTMKMLWTGQVIGINAYACNWG